MYVPDFDGLIRFCVIIILILLPLAIWKIVDIVIWLFHALHHLHMTWS